MRKAELPYRELASWWRSLAIDARSMTLFRVGLGAVVLVDVLLRLPHWRLTISESGFAPRAAVLDAIDANRWSLYYVSGNDAFVLLLLTGTLIAAILLIVGLRPRLMAFALWVLVVSLHNRAPMLLNSGDTYLRLMLLWSVFLPLHRGVGATNAFAGETDSVDRPAVGEIGLRVQVATVYFVSVFFKTGFSWISGTAVYDALSNGMYSRPLGQALLELPSFVWPVWTYGVVLIEIAAPLLLFVPATL